MELQVSQSALAAMCEAARGAAPNEACGLLLGAQGAILNVVPTRNVHSNPATHFEIDPQALIDAHRAARGGGSGVAGYFHSHPSGEPVPSETDRAMAARDGKVWAIIAGDGIRFWQDNPKGFDALSYEVIED